MQELGSVAPVVELGTAPGWQEFFDRFVRTNVPVVLRGHAAAQRAFSHWTDSYLAEHWGSKMISVELNKTEERGGRTLEMTLGAFLKEMYDQERAGELYAVIDFDQDQQARSDFDLAQPIACKEIFPQSLTLWLSSGGTSSVLHEDDAENFLMLLEGTKTVMLVHQDQAAAMYAGAAAIRGTSPVHQSAVDLAAFPRFANISWLLAELRAGDTLYIPHSYWHQVTSGGRRNAAVNFWWGHRDEWRWWDPDDREEYDPTAFGSPGRPRFDELKGRLPFALPCTPPAEGSLASARFVGEARWKKHLVRSRAKAAKAAKAAGATRSAGARADL